MPNALIAALKNNRRETEAIIKAAPDWTIANRAFDAFFKNMINHKDSLWSEDFIRELHHVYLEARDRDKSCANITIRTVKAMPKTKAESTKKVMLQMAGICRIFNASHKVNFEPDELPHDFDDVPVQPAAKKGYYTYKDEMPSLYPKTSLTFDYWVPKLLDWTKEVRENKIKDWKNEAINAHEACTDFMRVCLLFISDHKNNVPVAKAEDREAFLKLFGEPFAWIKKSAKREDIAANSAGIKKGLAQLARDTGILIPLEAWNRLQQAAFVKPIIKQA
ncbi:MAG: hypothetical protein FD123_975 [Bacteroidetes bacterium]|nr:MAG: hypothetical protein FD123_975 [Bacteroidota bacterium]